jgi:protease IV
MTLLRRLWRLLVGVKDALALLFLALFFVIVWGALQERAPLPVPSGSALVLDLDGQIVDQANQRPLLGVVRGDGIGHQIEVRDLIRAIDLARTNSHIKAIVLNLDAFTGSGQANLQTIGRALAAFRAQKPIYAYATAYTDDSYYLAAHATRAWISPLGGVLLTGPGGTNLYFKTALDKLNIDVNVFRVGTYKSAVEPFTRSDSSPEARAASQALVDTLWASYRADVARVRPGVDLDAFLGNLPARVQAAGGSMAQAAVVNKLVDQIGTRADFGRAMAKIVGDGRDDTPGNYNAVSLGRFLAATAQTRERGPAVGVVYVAGDIVDGDAPSGTAGGDTIARQLDEALTDSDIKALVVRIDSPGGSVSASERIREALIEARRRNLPVVASFGSVAASGGYWVSTAAETVYAEPATITGSIGVFAVIPSFNRALAKFGIGADGVKSTPYSGEPDVLRGLSPGTRALLQASVEDIYRRFTGLVAKSRNLPLARVDEIGQGRVWAGSTAKTLGLVNHFGGLDDAVADAARRAGLPADVRTIAIEPSTPFVLQLLTNALGGGDDQPDEAQARDPFAHLVQRDHARIFAALAQAQAVASGPTIQVGCLDCATLLPPRGAAVARGRSMLALALGGN